MLVVRLLTAGDRSAHDGLLRELDAAHHAALPHLIRAPSDSAVSEERYLQRIADAKTFFAGAETDLGIVGFIRASLVETAGGRAHLPRRYAEIAEIIVRQDVRRQGLGRALMTATREWARRNGSSSLELNVYTFNAEAAAFYAREGLAMKAATYSMLLD
jgi:GNAT superfamily N-acetyltransferase